MIDFMKSKLTREEYQTIDKMVDRLESIIGSVDRMAVSMDIDACNMTVPLDLKKLEAFDDLNFTHDIDGIQRHLDRETGELENCFLPRCAK